MCDECLTYPNCCDATEDPDDEGGMFDEDPSWETLDFSDDPGHPGAITVPDTLAQPVSPAAPWSVYVDTDRSDAMNRLYTYQFISGSYPLAHAWSATVGPGSKVRYPEGMILTRMCGSRDTRYELYEGTIKKHKVLMYVILGGGVINVRTAGTDEGVLHEIEKHMRRDLLPRPRKDDQVQLGFWHMGASGCRRFFKPIQGRPWNAVSGNYSAKAHDVMADLAFADPNAFAGRIALLWGQPGTGKTNFLRSLSWEWRSWCSVEYITDPENFLNSGDYIMSVLASEANEPKGTSSKQPGEKFDILRHWDEPNTKGRWRMLVLEDSGELIAADAKARAGQALSRLLNVTDGLLSEGQNLLVAITTNESINALHPAVTRPGRCFTNLELPPLSVDEANKWLRANGCQGYTETPMTLAELFACKHDRGVKTSVAEQESAGGQYL